MIQGFYFITDSGLTKKTILSDVETALAAGVKIVQYRNKNVETKSMYDEAKQLRLLCSNALFIINDRIDIALAVNADGVHLGQEDMPYLHARKLLGKERIIGITVHTINEAFEAEKQGADYLGVSPIFLTATKKDAGPPAGLQLIKDIKKSSSLPLVAIGGITLQNAPSVISAGADAICAISATVATQNVKEAVKAFEELF